MVANEADSKNPDIGYLREEVVLGNISNFVVAGHETTANTLAFTVAVLALHPDMQRKVHEELVTIFGTDRISNPETWSYETDFPRLLNGVVGAVQNETMRLFPLAPTSTRKTTTAQVITVDGQQHTLPAECRCFPSTVATHTNPKYWGSLLSSFERRSVAVETEKSCVSDDFIMAQKLGSWDPMRWLSHTGHYGHLGAFVEDSNVVPDGSSLLGEVKTARAGTFLPFSRGTRSCIGTRFAQVELCAFMARFFSEYEVRVEDSGCEGEEAARRLLMEQVTTRAETTLTYKPADEIKLVAVPWG